MNLQVHHYYTSTSERKIIHVYIPIFCGFCGLVIFFCGTITRAAAVAITAKKIAAVCKAGSLKCIPTKDARNTSNARTHS